MMGGSRNTVLPSVRQYGFSNPQHIPRSQLLKTLRRRHGKMIVHESFVRLGKCRRYFKQSGFLFKLQRNTARHKRRVFNFCIAYGIFRCFCQSLLAVSFLSPVTVLSVIMQSLSGFPFCFSNPAALRQTMRGLKLSGFPLWQ